MALAFVQILLGALVAGIDAGRSYVGLAADGGRDLPLGRLHAAIPLWSNFLANPGLVQFNHRLVGYVLFLLGLFAWLRSRGSALGHVRGAFAAMMAMLALQLVLGVLTVMHAAPLGSPSCTSSGRWRSSP